MTRWLRFRLSSLLWATLCCALMLGWWKDHHDLRYDLRQADLLQHADALAEIGDAQSSFASRELAPEMPGPSDTYKAPALRTFQLAATARGAGWRSFSKPDDQPGIIRSFSTTPEDLRALAKMLKDTDAETRAGAAGLLVSCTTERITYGDAKDVASALADALGDSNPIVRCQAAFALVSMNAFVARQSAPAIKAAWYREKEPEVADYLLEVWHHLDPEGVDAALLIARLEGDDPKTQARAAQMLGSIRGDNGHAAVPRLLALIHAKDESLRTSAILSLGSLATREEALAPLLRVFEHAESDETRFAAAKALHALTRQQRRSA